MNVNTETETKSAEALLSELLAYQKKEVRHTRIATLANIILVVVLLVAVVIDILSKNGASLNTLSRFRVGASRKETTAISSCTLPVEMTVPVRIWFSLGISRPISVMARAAMPKLIPSRGVRQLSM